jgi:2-polyprenyl-6-methoxyphenol hydroxylase-like FAD-dependent oxidoreductase
LLQIKNWLLNFSEYIREPCGPPSINDPAAKGRSCMTNHDVIIVGGGPTGLMLAGELALAGVDAAIVERRPNQEVAGTRAGGLLSRTLEVLDQRNIVDRFLAEGQRAQTVAFARVRLDLSGFPTRHPYTLGLRQKHLERILAGWVDELKTPIYRGLDVTDLSQDETGASVDLSDGRSLRGQYLVGCDGGHSLVRKAAGIGFPGTEPITSNLIAEAEFAETPPEWGIRRDALGTHALGRVEYEIRNGEIVYANHGPVSIMVTEQPVNETAEPPTLSDLSAALIAVYGTDYGVHSPTSISRFTDAARQAADYRTRRVLIAGDAAHVHPPDGGQGLQTGVQDAVNLGWKLAQVIKGVSPDSLLDTYRAERHPIGARVLRNTMAAIVLRREDDRTKALRDTIAELLGMDEPRRRFAATMCVSTFIMTSARGIHCSVAGCPISTWSPQTARCGSSACSIPLGRCCSTSANPAPSKLGHGRTGSNWWSPNTVVSGSSQLSGRSPRLPPSWSGRTAMSLGWETRLLQVWRTRWLNGLGRRTSYPTTGCALFA